MTKLFGYVFKMLSHRKMMRLVHTSRRKYCFDKQNIKFKGPMFYKIPFNYVF